nr:AGE family epimerase/isomerase [Roseibium sp. Sym1]
MQSVAFGREVEKLEDWLTNAALPLWLDAGCDPVHGGFQERIRQDGQPSTTDNRRARVQPRQIYCYAAAGARGWTGNWRTASRDAYDLFEKVYRRSDGFYGNLASPDGELIDDGFDLYNQAFALFAFAEFGAAFPERQAEMEEKARALLAALKATYAHPQLGFEEAVPVKLPLCSNPHMHLFEAALAWETAAAEPAPWTALADEIALLAMTRFIDADTGALREFFDHDWAPFEGDKGRIVEPGHQFEWAWLLCRWGESRGRADALEKAKRLFAIGTFHGICEDRQVAFMGLYDDFSVSDPVARLWPQTEWLKAAGILARQSGMAERSVYLREAVRACQALGKFFETPLRGLWFDKLKPDGSFVDEPAPASSFYHIVCAIHEARDTLDLLAAEGLKKSA